MVNQILLEKLIDVLLREFSLDDLQDICFDLGIDYEYLMGVNKGPKSRSLVELLNKQNRIPELIEAGRRLRPHIKWPDADSYVEGLHTSARQDHNFANLAAIRDVLLTQFNSAELLELSYMVDVDYDSISGATNSAKARELVSNMHRRGLLDLLVTQIRQLRPNISIPFDIQTGDGIPGSPPNQPIVEALEVVAEAKLIFVGHGNVGKTSIMQQFFCKIV